MSNEVADVVDVGNVTSSFTGATVTGHTMYLYVYIYIDYRYQGICQIVTFIGGIALEMLKNEDF